MQKNKASQIEMPFRQKTGLMLLGLFLFFILLEAGLRLSGFIILSLQEHRNMASIRKRGEYRIMCLGESTTALGGNNSYPSQLEELLNQLNLGIEFSVINKGVIGISSTGLVKKLPVDLDEYKPDIVVVMMGINDEPLAQGEISRPYRKRNNFLTAFRTYKLIRLIRQSILSRLNQLYYRQDHLVYPDKETTVSQNNKLYLREDGAPLKNNSVVMESGQAERKQIYINQAEYCFDIGDYKEAVANYKKAIEIDPLCYGAYIGMGWSYECLAMYAESIDAFKKAIGLDNINYMGYRGLAHAYCALRNFAEAKKLLERVIDLHPYDDLAYLLLADCYIYEKKYTQAEEVLKKCISKNVKDDKIYGRLALIYQSQGKHDLSVYYHRRANDIREGYDILEVQENFKKIKQILGQRNIRLACVQYPMRSVKSLVKIFDGQERIIFIDNETIFKNAVEKEGYGVYFTDTFGGDFGHCTPKGNKLLAENIAQAILKEVFGR